MGDEPILAEQYLESPRTTRAYSTLEILVNLECFQLFSAKNTYVSLIDIIFPRRRFDSHLPAAAAARAAWSSAFPPHKQAGALTHCQTEILELVSNNWF